MDILTIYSNHKNILVQRYIEQLCDTEKQALKIAHQQLETSFDIEKSIGFLEWNKSLSTASSTTSSTTLPQ
jgi:hypothetical protein